MKKTETQTATATTATPVTETRTPLQLAHILTKGGKACPYCGAIGHGTISVGEDGRGVFAKTTCRVCRRNSNNYWELIRLALSHEKLPVCADGVRRLYARYGVGLDSINADAARAVFPDWQGIAV